MSWWRLAVQSRAGFDVHEVSGSPSEKTRRLLGAIPVMVNVIDHGALRLRSAWPPLAKNAVICSMSLGDILAEPNMLAGFVSSERSMSIAFSNIATWNASERHGRF